MHPSWRYNVTSLMQDRTGFPLFTDTVILLHRSHFGLNCLRVVQCQRLFVMRLCASANKAALPHGILLSLTFHTANNFQREPWGLMECPFSPQNASIASEGSKRVARGGGGPAGRLLPLATFYEDRLLSSVNPNALWLCIYLPFDGSAVGKDQFIWYLF